MTTSTIRNVAAAPSADTFLNELISALPIVILARAVRASWKPRADLGGSLQSAVSI